MTLRDSVQTRPLEVIGPAGTDGTAVTELRHVITDVIGNKHGIGVENLAGSGKGQLRCHNTGSFSVYFLLYVFTRFCFTAAIAGETARAYREIFTLSYVTGRTVGIGAYLVRLGQRVIQKKAPPIILTGYQALNKLLGKQVYASNLQVSFLPVFSVCGL